MTYSDNQNLYISIGYGEQKTGGYSIAVDALYLTDDAIHVSTSLLGPDITGQKEGAGKPSTPYIVLKQNFWIKPCFMIKRMVLTDPSKSPGAAS